MNYKEEIINAFVGVCKRARKEGYAEGLKRGEDIEQANAAETKKEVARLNYEQGLNDAWECARKIIQEEPFGLTTGELEQIFDTHSIATVIERNTASEAIAKIKEYEENQKQIDDEIKVGDEVIYDGGRIGVIVQVDKYGYRSYQIMNNHGECGCWITDDIKKTGRHFPQIAEVLKQMQEGKE